MAKDFIICPHCGKRIHYTYYICPLCKEIANPLNENRVNKPECLWYGWAWYLIFMVVSLFFKEWYWGWIAATYIFFTWRKQKIYEVNQ